jgi:hypothetical protein
MLYCFLVVSKDPFVLLSSKMVTDQGAPASAHHSIEKVTTVFSTLA